ncbi:tyrosine-type recombinase/integrase [Dankookia sp. GCM10030260]|uniref:tyrosine-type recombinase/integrase n=1 Tax=Dankookia sp. GCM10030260 TaxID=3273390 RepID=UPI003617A34C
MSEAARSVVTLDRGGANSRARAAAEMPPPGISRLCWPLEWWPAVDQAAWTLGFTPGDPFDDPRYGTELRLGSRTKIRKGYGRWLSFLAKRGWFDPAQPPLARATRPRLRAYFRTLRAAGNADRTIIGRFGELTMALKVLAPGEDVSWVMRPDGVSIYAMLPKAQRMLLVPDADVLFAWGLEMMDEAAARPREPGPLTAYRDGLLIALFAARGRRLRSMALLRVGRELVQRGGRFRVELTPDQVKTDKPDRFDLPDRLTSYLRHYLDSVRPALLRDRPEDAVWVSAQGGALTEAGIQSRIRRLTRRRFGQAFGPHRFRHAIATTTALHVPTHPGLAAGLLGISSGVLEQHYNRARQCQAATRFAEVIEQRRRRRPGT